MLSLEAFTGRDLQGFLTLLNLLEANGVSDVRFARQKIQEHVNESFLNNRREMSAERRQEVKTFNALRRTEQAMSEAGVPNPACIECNTPMKLVAVEDDLAFFQCTSCRWSRPVSLHELGVEEVRRGNS